MYPDAYHLYYMVVTDGVSHREIIDGPWVITIEDFVTDEERLYRMQILQ